MPLEGKVALSFETEFSLGKEQTQGRSSSNETTVGVNLEVAEATSIVVAYVTTDGRVFCYVDINAAGDWRIRITVNLRGEPLGSHNFGILKNSDAWKSTSTGGYLEFETHDDMVRFLLGYDVACIACADLAWQHGAGNAAENLQRMQLPAERHIVIDATREQASSLDAGYRIIDVTGYDPDCVAKQFSQVGHPDRRRPRRLRPRVTSPNQRFRTQCTIVIRGRPVNEARRTAVTDRLRSATLATRPLTHRSPQWPRPPVPHSSSLGQSRTRHETGNMGGGC